MILNTPVLFLIFNRLETTKQVFAVIRQVRPRHLYIASDGPRSDRADEKEKVQTVRDYVLKNIDWPCEVKTLFREENLGCGMSVSGAITWFFEQVEQGIILEDDCVPALSFFSYCTELLTKYKDKEKIYHISGHNPLGVVDMEDSYYYARVQHCWGWASWRRAWTQYSFDIQDLAEFIEQKKLNNIFQRRCDCQYWLGIFYKMEKHLIDTWDYQWIYAILKNDGICINPAKNMISNIGFAGDGTHTTLVDSPFNNQKRYELAVINHPKEIVVSDYLVIAINKILYGSFNFWESIANFVVDMPGRIKRAGNKLCRFLSA
jgi:hypothetical protein